MLGEKIDYNKIRKMMLYNLEDLHSEVFHIREAVRDIHRMQVLMWSYVKNEKYLEFVKSRKKRKASASRSSKVMDDIIDFDKAHHEIITEAENELRKTHKERMKEYKESID